MAFLFPFLPEIFEAGAVAAEEAAPLLAEELGIGYGSTALAEEIFQTAGPTVTERAALARDIYSNPGVKEIITGVLGSGAVAAGDEIYSAASGKRKNVTSDNRPGKKDNPFTHGDDEDWGSNIDPPSDDDDDIDLDDDGLEEPTTPINPYPGTVYNYDGREDNTQDHQKIMTENRKFSVPPIFQRHRGNYRPPHGIKPITVQGYRTYEMECGSGTMSSASPFYWNTKDDLIKQMDISIRNYLTQTQQGYLDVTKATTTEGATTDINSTTVQSQQYSFILMHKKEYIITNQSTNDCLVILRCVTPKTNTTLTFDACTDDTTFESLNTADIITYNGGATKDLTSVVEKTSLQFNPFRHRYKCRKMYREVGHRAIRLRPGDTCCCPVIDKGPWLISRIALNELHQHHANAYPEGYARTIYFELRGTDIAFSKETTNNVNSTAQTAIGIIEKTTLVLSSYPVMRARKFMFTTAAITNNQVTTSTYTVLGQIADGSERVVNNDDKISQPMNLVDNTDTTINQ